MNDKFRGDRQSGRKYAQGGRDGGNASKRDGMRPPFKRSDAGQGGAVKTARFGVGKTSKSARRAADSVGRKIAERVAGKHAERPEVPEDVCWGRQPVLDLVKNSPSRCTRLLIANNVRPPYLDELTDAARAGRVVYQMTAPEALDRLCPGERHQGVACRITDTKPVDLDEFLLKLPQDSPALIVVLDHIEDPHNLGATVRSAEAGGAAAVVYSKRRSALPGGTVVKTSAGASLRLPMIPVVNISRTLQRLKEADFWVAGLDGEAETDIFGEKLPRRLAMVIGAEGEGLSRLVSETCDQLLRIPIEGKVGSLNASVAGAIGIFEWRKNINAECGATHTVRVLRP